MSVKDGKISIVSSPDVVLVPSSNSYCSEAESLLDPASFEATLASQASGDPIVSSNQLGVEGVNLLLPLCFQR